MAERPLKSRLWYGMLTRACQLVAVVGYRVRHTGVHNIPRRGGVLVISNHQSHFDPPLVGMGCPRRMNYVARDTLFRFGPFGWLIQSLDAIPIDREGLGLSGIKESLRRLKRGEMLLMFPEGTRTNDGAVGPFRPGFTTLATRSKAAILPVAIEGAFAAWPRWHSFPRLGTIHVHYGEPMLPAEIAGRDERELVTEVECRVRECHAQVKQQRKKSGIRDEESAV
jgi:1-acyl-sn-glycerol-3-phosphate acyltransferase